MLVKQHRMELAFSQQSASAPAGKPDLLFEVPSVIGYREQGVAVKESDIDIIQCTKTRKCTNY